MTAAVNGQRDAITAAVTEAVRAQVQEKVLAAVRAKLTLEPEEELAPIGSGGFGLHNVAQRIQMYYGDQAEILVESEKNIGTCFKVYLGN